MSRLSNWVFVSVLKVLTPILEKLTSVLRVVTSIAGLLKLVIKSSIASKIRCPSLNEGKLINMGNLMRDNTKGFHKSPNIRLNIHGEKRA